VTIDTSFYSDLSQDLSPDGRPHSVNSAKT
jgi:hypothetical protein